jgi:hypothetical protein
MIAYTFRQVNAVEQGADSPPPCTDADLSKTSLILITEMVVPWNEPVPWIGARVMVGAFWGG